MYTCMVYPKEGGTPKIYQCHKGRLKREPLLCQGCFVPDLGVAANFEHLSRALCVIQIEFVPVALVSSSLTFGGRRG